MRERKNLKIGLEIHLRLYTGYKLFSNAPNRHLIDPNTCIDPHDLGIPGTLPILNKECLIQAIKMSVALNSNIAQTIAFDRKHYRYPDLPSCYQLTQDRMPISTGGGLPNNENLIKQIHIEADAAKTCDDGSIDYNRSGQPLIEIVTWPMMHSNDEVIDCIKTIREIALCTVISRAKLHAGDMRWDLNISWEGIARQEVKNLNSYKSTSDSIKNLLEVKDEELIESYTWDYNVKKGLKKSRIKEKASDYHVFPECNIPEIQIDYDKSKVNEFIKNRICLLGILKSKELTHSQIVDLMMSKHLKRLINLLNKPEFEVCLEILLNDNDKLTDNTISKILSFHGSLNQRQIRDWAVKGVEPKIYEIIDAATLKEILMNNFSEQWSALLAGQQKMLNFLTGKLASMNYDPKMVRGLLETLLNEHQDSRICEEN